MSVARMSSTPICPIPTVHLHPLRKTLFNGACCYNIPGRHCVTYCTIQHESSKRLLYVHQLRGRDHRDILKPVSAVGSGLETSMADSEGSTLTLKRVEVAVESQDAEKIKLRVDLSEEETQKAFDVVLSNLARSAPPIPGFRRQKGGKTSKVPKNLLLDIIGRERVTNFVIREIVTSAVGGYVEKENLSVRDNKINTIQSEDELKQTFLPGNAFGFNVELELVNEVTEADVELEPVNEETEADVELEPINEETEAATTEAEL